MKSSSLLLPFGLIALSLALSCARSSTQLDYSELLPILNQNNLSPTNDPGRLAVAKIEEADSNLYRPLAGTTIYLESPYPTFDSKNVRPRYWLRVEDFTTRELAAKRAAEYIAIGTYDRLNHVYPHTDTSKTSVRLWAIARGKRVYALTTDSSLLTYISLPENLRKSISVLPET
jgi:hypothetical protein